YQEAMNFRNDYNFNATVSVSAMGTAMAVVKRASKKSDPNVQVLGIDEDYFALSGYEIQSGRGFNGGDLDAGFNYTIVGIDIVEKLFDDHETAVGEVIGIGSYKYQIIGVIKSKGQAFGMSADNQCFIPITNLKKSFATENTNYRITVAVNSTNDMSAAIDEAYATGRSIRGDVPGEEESFEIQESNQLVENMNDAIGGVQVAATVIGLITLFGAGIGLMNIMLVSVTERTREIGVRKAIGASSKVVLSQFLAEAVIIGQIGGVLGIILGLLVGNLVALVMETPFVVPWTWIIIGVIMCFIVSVLSGWYPAYKASKLNPIDALRHE
ncbi:MAG: ABC transporter permease, partial [Flavobacteriales bacterium]